MKPADWGMGGTVCRVLTADPTTRCLHYFICAMGWLSFLELAHAFCRLGKSVGARAHVSSELLANQAAPLRGVSRWSS